MEPLNNELTWEAAFCKEVVLFRKLKCMYLVCSLLGRFVILSFIKDFTVEAVAC